LLEYFTHILSFLIGFVHGAHQKSRVQSISISLLVGFVLLVLPAFMNPWNWIQSWIWGKSIDIWQVMWDMLFVALANQIGYHLAIAIGGESRE